MESLESRIARLPPEQQREVEDFVDFLLLRNNIRQVAPPVSPSPVINTPPVMALDLSTSGPALVVPGVAARKEPPSPILNADPAPAAFQEITAGGEDWITRDYMDYSKFEEQTSPATDAVRNVKRKLIAREEKDARHHLLDWVD